jgi:hypothetical protein
LSFNRPVAWPTTATWLPSAETARPSPEALAVEPSVWVKIRLPAESYFISATSWVPEMAWEEST